MLTNQISPPDQQFAQLQSYPKDTPLVMLNILKFKEKTSTNESGQEVYARYFKNAQPFVVESGAKLIWKGKVHSVLVGDSDQQPQLVFVVEYPSVDHFFKMVMNSKYQKIASDRGLALEYGGLIACQIAE